MNNNMISGLQSSYLNDTYSTTTNSLKNKLDNNDLTKATDEELMEVCKDFESYYMEQMLKSMAKMAKVDGTSDSNNIYSSLFGMTENSDTGMNTLAGFFGDEMVSKMAEQMADSNGGKGLGLAQMLYEQMKRTNGI